MGTPSAHKRMYPIFPERALRRILTKHLSFALSRLQTAGRSSIGDRRQLSCDGARLGRDRARGVREPRHAFAALDDPLVAELSPDRTALHRAWVGTLDGVGPGPTAQLVAVRPAFLAGEREQDPIDAAIDRSRDPRVGKLADASIVRDHGDTAEALDLDRAAIEILA